MNKIKFSESVKIPNNISGIYFFIDKNGMLLYIGKAVNIKKRMYVYKDDLDYFSNVKKLFYSIIKKSNLNELDDLELNKISSIIDEFTNPTQYVTRFLSNVEVIGFFECPISELETEEKRQIHLYKPPTNYQTLDKSFVFNTDKKETDFIEKVNLELSRRLTDKDIKKDI